MADDAPRIRPSDVQGVKYFDRLLPRLPGLHEVGTERDKAGSRKLHFDEYCVLILLSMFSPVLRSVRALQQASTLKNVQQKLGCPRISLGSFSEAVDVFDPQRLEAIVGELLIEVPMPEQGVGKDYVRQRLTAVDGSVVKTLAPLAEAAYLKDKNGASQSGWRFHTQFEIDRHVPTRIEVTTALNGGKTDEKSILRKNLESNRCYVTDRWYGEFALFNEIVAKSSSYVCRIRDNSKPPNSFASD